MGAAMRQEHRRAGWKGMRVAVLVAQKDAWPAATKWNRARPGSVPKPRPNGGVISMRR